MAKIKICGLRRTEDIEYVNELKPDFVGFILSPGFRRSIDFDTFKSLRGNLSDDISAIGVFVNEPLESIEKFTDSGLIDFVQLHGGESPQYAEQITLPVIKALKPCDFDKMNTSNVSIISSSTAEPAQARHLIGKKYRKRICRFFLPADSQHKIFLWRLQNTPPMW